MSIPDFKPDVLMQKMAEGKLFANVVLNVNDVETSFSIPMTKIINDKIKVNYVAKELENTSDQLQRLYYSYVESWNFYVFDIKYGKGLANFRLNAERQLTRFIQCKDCKVKCDLTNNSVEEMNSGVVNLEVEYTIERKIKKDEDKEGKQENIIFKIKISSEIKE